MDLPAAYKPKINAVEASLLVETLYGFKPSEVTELNGYDDKNFKVSVDLNTLIVDNNFNSSLCEDGYVLKVVNSLDSKNLEYYDAQIKLMVFLKKHNIRCPQPVKNRSGHFFSLEKINEKEHIVRLLEYQPGTILHSLEEKTDDLYKQVGKYIASLDEIMKNFNHPAITRHETIWMLEAFPETEKFANVITDVAKRTLYNEISTEFKEKVVPNLNRLERGIIHGDFNEANILLEKNSADSWDVMGVIDFGDTHVTCLFFEVAITISYAILETQNIEIGRAVLHGYREVRSLNETEINLLQVSVASRILQSVTLGLYAFSQDPENQYALTTQKTGWDMLVKIWKYDKDKLLTLWLGET